MALQIDWKLFLSTLPLIFVAELPDKTAFATLLLAIFIGVAMAFVIQSVVAVSFGSALGLLSRLEGSAKPLTLVNCYSSLERFPARAASHR
jgi:putative Ca2+/H+ antiporter (TMEM165/GDT1 family)